MSTTMTSFNTMSHTNVATSVIRAPLANPFIDDRIKAALSRTANVASVVFPVSAALLLVIGFGLMAVPMFSAHATGFLAGSVLSGR